MQFNKYTHTHHTHTHTHAGMPSKTKTTYTMSLDTAQCCCIGSRIGSVAAGVRTGSYLSWLVRSSGFPLRDTHENSGDRFLLIEISLNHMRAGRRKLRFYRKRACGSVFDVPTSKEARLVRSVASTVSAPSSTSLPPSPTLSVRSATEIR